MLSVKMCGKSAVGQGEKVLSVKGSKSCRSRGQSAVDQGVKVLSVKGSKCCR